MLAQDAATAQLQGCWGLRDVGNDAHASPVRKQAQLAHDDEGCRKAQGARKERASILKGHLPLGAFPYATPAHIQWSRELHNESRHVQEQVNYSIDAAKMLRTAEALIRPICAMPV